MGIPLIIHYCWFGNQMPDKVLNVIDSWREHLPDYKFYLWSNEHLGDYDVKFLKQAYYKKAYAFVADYYRLRKVYEYGGFYLDTDMLLLRPLDKFSSLDFVICSEIEDRPAWGFFGSEKNNSYLRECFEKYHSIEYDQFKPPVIPYFLKDITLNYIKQKPNNRLNVGPEFFYPMPVEQCCSNYLSFVTDKTIGVHLWDFSWLEIKLNRTLTNEIIYRLKILFLDLISFKYSPYYFRINLIRIIRLLKKKND